MYSEFAMIVRIVFAGFVALLLSGQVASATSGTGQTTCFSATGITDCVFDIGFPRQDGSTGSAIVYAKLNITGGAVDETATEWSCVRDEATKLVWEAKTPDGLRAVGHRYAWANADTATNGGDTGGTTETAACGDSLNGQSCTSEAYVAAVNAAGLCGFNDWRVPSQRELLTLVHAGRMGPAIDVSVFPLTASGVYWAADTHAPIPAFAWGVHFGSGTANATYKNRLNHLRLVRGAKF